MKVEYLTVGVVGTNCYIAVNEETKEALIVDPGDNSDAIARKIENLGVTPVAILLTHGHFDHVMAAEELHQRYEIPRYVHARDKALMLDPNQNCGLMIGANEPYESDETVSDNEVLHLAGFDIQVIETPGHTPGGVCYYFKEQGVLFSGDTLFCESVGRTDLPGGKMSTLLTSIKERVFKLPDLTIVYPGHNEPTQIGYEKQYNPFV